MAALAGARVLVTGGSEGIGLQVARLCVQRGAQVTVLSRDPGKVPPGLAVQSVAADVTDPATLTGLDADVLVACAGGAEPGHFLELDAATLRRQVELNLLGAAFSVQAVLPGMLARGSGHLVLVSSAAALEGVFGYGGYGPAKAGLVNLGAVLRAEYGDRGVGVTLAFPPDTTTPGFARENATKPAQTHAVSALVQPVGAEKVAAAIVRGIERDRRTVTADAATAALARATCLVAPLARWQMRRAVRGATP